MIIIFTAGGKKGVTAVSAGTFYWIALADFADSFHERAVVLTRTCRSQHSLTTDEVLTEFLNYFGGQPNQRRPAAATVRRLRYSLTDCVHTDDQTAKS